MKKTFRITPFIMLITVMLFSIAAVQAQTRPLKKGDKFPDRAFPAVGFDKPTVNLADYHGKFVLLDFWATWCAPCLGLMPRVDSMAKLFRDKLVVVPVTSDNAHTITAFIPDFEKTHGISLRSIVSDSLLSRLAGVTGIPLYCWIDLQGRLIGKTGGEALTPDNIRKVMAGTYAFTTDNRQLKYPNGNLPVFQVANTYDSSYYQSQSICYSAFSRWVPGYESMLSSEPPFQFVNVTPMWLYQTIFGHNDWYFQNPLRVFWEVNDSSIYRYSLQAETDTYNREGAKALHDLLDSTEFCYELHAPVNMPIEDQYRWMEDDLNHYFGNLLGIEGHRVRRNMQCLVLETTGNFGEMLHKNLIDTTSRKYYDFITVGDLLAYCIHFGNYKGMPPLVDGTNLVSPTTQMPLPIQVRKLPVKSLKDLSAVNNYLAQYGLKFVLENRVIDVIVIRKKGDFSDEMRTIN